MSSAGQFYLSSDIALGLTQAQLAERLGVHIGVPTKYEQGLNVPGGGALAAIARTGVDMRWLRTGEGEMLSKPAPEQVEEGIDVGSRHRRWRQLIELVEASDDPDRMLSDLLAR